MRSIVSAAALGLASAAVGLVVGFLLGRREYRQQKVSAAVRLRLALLRTLATFGAGDRWLLPEVREECRLDLERALALTDEVIL